MARDLSVDWPGASALVAGVVVAVGTDVAGFSIGDRVYGCVGGVRGSPGTYAELVAADAQAQSVTGLANGSYVIAWQGSDADGSGVFFRQFDASGTPCEARAAWTFSTSPAE